MPIFRCVEPPPLPRRISSSALPSVLLSCGVVFRANALVASLSLGCGFLAPSLIQAQQIATAIAFTEGPTVDRAGKCTSATWNARRAQRAGEEGFSRQTAGSM